VIWRSPDQAAERIKTGASGVYLIRSKGGAIVYIGESHTGRLRKTMKHHFQSWTGPTAGPRFSAAGHEVAIVPASAARAVAVQDKLIARHQPRDNTIGLESKARASEARALARDRWTFFGLLLSLLIAGATVGLPAGQAQERAAMSWRADGLWLVLTNAPPRWQLSYSADGRVWVPYLVKPDPDPLQLFELRLSTNAAMQFWRLESLP